MNRRRSTVEEPRFIKQFTYYSKGLKRPISVRPHDRIYHVKDKNAAVYIKHPNRNLWDGVYPNKFDPVESNEAKLLKWVEEDGTPKSNFPPETFGVQGITKGLNKYLYEDVKAKHKDLKDMLVLSQQLQNIKDPKVDKEVTRKVDKMREDLERLHDKTSDRQERDFVRGSLEDIDKLEESMVYARRGTEKNYQGIDSRMKAMKGILNDLKPNSRPYQKMQSRIPPDIRVRGIGSQKKMAETHARGVESVTDGIERIFESNMTKNQVKDDSSYKLLESRKLTNREYKSLKQMEEKINKVIDQDPIIAEYSPPVLTI